MFAQIQNFALDLLFPKQCLVCGRFDTWFCDNCQKYAKFEDRQLCVNCGRPSLNGAVHPGCFSPLSLDGLMAAGNFHQLQGFIHSLKYGLVKELAPALGQILTNFILLNGLENFLKDFSIVPVPLHAARLRFRGFNQSELMARQVCHGLNLCLSPQPLVRLKNTDPQTTLDKRKRQYNVQNAFICTEPGLAKGKKILLIDDITTTGATLNECAKALKRARAASVWALVLARA